jgi:Peptidase family M3
MKTPATLLLCLLVGRAAAAPSVASIESAYADLTDAYGALGLIDSGFAATYGGKRREEWATTFEAKRAAVSEGLASVSITDLSPGDVRAVTVMRESVAALVEEKSFAPVRKCSEAQQKDLDSDALRTALYACFDELANNIEFEGAKLARVSAFDLLTRINEPERRKALFYAFVPLWRAVNGASEPDSPYRRMIAMAAADARTKGSAIDAAARTVGVSTAELERWLEQVLGAWRRASGDSPIEPWDYRYVGGAADREIGDAVSLASMQPLNERYYADLGANLKEWGVMYDLEPRKGKAPLAYADYVRRGRMVNGAWRPTVARVSGNYARGGLGPLNELVHENGHIVHMMALRTRPAFMDLGDPVFYEAFADVPSWSVYEPAWQQRYLGRRASEAASLRALYSNVMLDVAWSLFDLRMLRDPTRDPNVVWTDITSRYLNVVPHPDLSWWAVRVQLAESPGYMINYGLGAVITAHIRRRITEQLGPFATGDARWYAWLSERLLSSGYEQETATLLREFLGGPVSADALVQELKRIRTKE